MNLFIKETCLLEYLFSGLHKQILHKLRNIHVLV